MSEPQLITFRRYNDVALSAGLVSLLVKHDITYELLESPMVFSASLAFNEENNKEFVVKLLPEDFDRVEQLILEDEAQHIDNVDSDYYLFAFSDSELLDVVVKYDEWGAFDLALSRKLLNERGVVIDDTRMSEIKAQGIETLRQPEKSQTIWVIIGYMSALLGCLFGFFIAALGIFSGWYLANGKKTLPNGERVYIYIETDRKHGKRIFYIAIIVFVITFGMKAYDYLMYYSV